MKIDEKYALSILKNELKHLKDALKNSQDPYHYFYLSTINKNVPQSRTVVLRSINKNPLKLYFNTDKRSNKVNEIKKNPACNVLFYDNLRRIQLRLNCNAILHHKNKLTKNVWNNTVLQSRKCYMAPYPPSSKLEKWEANLPKKYFECDPSLEDNKKGYENFCTVELEVISFEIIELKYNGHIRFQINKNNNVDFLAS